MNCKHCKSRWNDLIQCLPCYIKLIFDNVSRRTFVILSSALVKLWDWIIHSRPNHFVQAANSITTDQIVRMKTKKISFDLFIIYTKFILITKSFAGKYRGIYLLDVGSGPVIIPIITASEWFDEIYLSDLSKDNIDFLRKWKDGETEATKAMEYQMSVFTLLDRKE